VAYGGYGASRYEEEPSGEGGKGDGVAGGDALAW
jgi:hypothetical protein